MAKRKPHCCWFLCPSEGAYRVHALIDRDVIKWVAGGGPFSSWETAREWAESKAGLTAVQLAAEEYWRRPEEGQAKP